MAQHFFITGIGTGVGKTLVSAFLVQCFQADYWKPVQAGDLEQSDSKRIRSLVDGHLTVFPERYRLRVGASPHHAAALEQLAISVQDFDLPASTRMLLIEGAGGLLVPLNDKEFMLDLISGWKLPVILVIRDYLGCINHSLLSIALLISKGLAIESVVFNGNFVPETKEIIQKHIPPGVKVWSIPELGQVDQQELKKVVAKFKESII